MSITHNISLTVPGDMLGGPSAEREFSGNYYLNKKNKIKTQAEDETIDSAGLLMTSTTSNIDIVADTEPDQKEMGLSARNEPYACGTKDDYQMDDTLKRPVIISQDTWSTTDTAMTQNGPNTALISLQFPQDLISASTLITEKLKNYRYLRSDLRVTVKVNANKMFAGCLMVVYQPFENIVSAVETSRTATHLAGQSSYPHALIKLGTNDSVTIHLPYCSDQEYYDTLNTDESEFGELKIFVLSPLRNAVTPSSVEVTTIASLVNPKVHGPTAQVPVAKVRKTFKNVGKHNASVKAMEKNFIKTQAEEAMIAKEGTVTKVTGGVASLLETAAPLISMIPVIGSAAEPLAWGARIANKVASSFGWCKAHTLTPQNRYTFNPGANMVNCEGADTSYVLAAIPDNRVNPVSAVPSEFDEMSFEYIFMRKYITASKYTWNTTDTADTQIFSISNSALTDAPNLTAGTDITVYGGVGEFLASHFAFWRGSIEYEIHFVKTIFHTGRVIIQFTTGDPTAGVQYMETIQTKIVDIEKQDSVKFTVPFICGQPYASVYRDTLSIPQFPRTGYVSMHVLNPSNAPSQVDTAIDVFVYKNYGKDFELAGFMSAMHMDPSYAMLKTQAGDFSLDNDSYLDNMVTDRNEDYMPVINKEPSQYCIGEKVTSVRQMIKRFGGQSGMAEIGDGLVNRYDDTHIMYQATSVCPNTGANAHYAPSILLSYMYRFYSGGSRFKVVTGGAPCRVFLNRLDSLDYLSGDTAEVYFTKENDVLEFEVPFYSPTRLKVIGLRDRRSVVLQFDSTRTAIPQTYVAGSDDANYNFLVGPPAWRVGAVAPPSGGW